MNLESLKKIANARTKPKWVFHAPDCLYPDGHIGSEDGGFVCEPLTLTCPDAIFIAAADKYFDQLLKIAEAAKDAIPFLGGWAGYENKRETLEKAIAELERVRE